MRQASSQLIPIHQVGLDGRRMDLLGGIDVANSPELECRLVVPGCQRIDECELDRLDRTHPVLQMAHENIARFIVVLVPHHQCFFGREVAIDRGRCDADLGGHIGHGDVVEASLLEQIERHLLGRSHRVDSLLAPLHGSDASRIILLVDAQNRSHSYFGVMAPHTTGAASAPVAASERHHFVDALRGFALLGILVVNIEFIVQPASLGWHEYNSTAEQIAQWFVTTFAQTKTYPIFAMLFGYGLGLQFERAKARDDQRSLHQMTKRTRRRNAALLVGGAAHGVLFFPGDILALYAIVGALCFRFREWPTAKLVKTAAWVYGGVSAIWLVLGVLDTIEGGSSFISQPDPADFAALSNGSFFDVVAVHVPHWIETFLFLVVLQGPAVIASFAAGIALSRTDILANPTRHREAFKRFLMRWAPGGFVIAGLAGWGSIAGIRTETIGFAAGFAVAPAIAASYIAVLGLTIGARRNTVAKVLQMAGSMSLTVYVAESVVATTIAYGYGLGWIGNVGAVAGIGLAVAIWLVLSFGANVWMRRFRFGPAEWLLRSITYGVRQPLRR